MPAAGTEDGGASLVGRVGRAAGHPRVRQLARYAGVSVLSTLIGLSVLVALVGTGAMGATWANVVATSVGTIPSFELNRRWVWQADGPRSLHRQVVPFVVLSFGGLVLSTLSVGLTASLVAGLGWSAGVRAVLAAVSNVAGLGVLWGIQFVILDRVLFGRDARRSVAFGVTNPTDSTGS